MSVRVAFWAHAYKQYSSHRMLSINRSEKIRLAIKAYLTAQGRGKTGNEREVVIISHGVGLYARKKLFVESWRLSLLPQQQLIGPVHVFNSAPDIVALVKLKCGFREVAVEPHSGFKHAISAP